MLTGKQIANEVGKRVSGKSEAPPRKKGKKQAQVLWGDSPSKVQKGGGGKKYA